MYTANFSDIIAVVTGAGEAVRTELINVDCGSVNRFCHIVPGDIAWDECDCGMFAQSITQTFPSDSFPTPASDSAETACGPKLYVATVRAVLIRCIQGPSDNGSPPTCDALASAAVQLECDRQALRQGIRCYLRALRQAYQIFEYNVGAVSTLGPEGLCGGVELTYQFAVGNPCC